jgi:hypothetical protein
MDRDTDTDAGTPRRLVIPAQRNAPGPLARRSAPTPFDVPAQRPGPRSVPRRTVESLGAAACSAPVHPADPALVRDAARSEVLHRHARLTRGGRPVFCTPSRDEIAGVVSLRQSRGTDGKVIYSTREAAEAAARELEELGTRALRSYRCGRSRSGHFHLTTDAASPARIPQQRRSVPA